MEAVVGIWLPVLGGMLLGETIIVLTLYWGAGEKRVHVIAISVSYLILVALGMQPALGESVRLYPGVHIGLAIIAYLLGSWALWRLVPVDAARKVVEGQEVSDDSGGDAP